MNAIDVTLARSQGSAPETCGGSDVETANDPAYIMNSARISFRDQSLPRWEPFSRGKAGA